MKRLILLIITLTLSGCAHKEMRVKNARKFIRNWDYDRALTELISLRNENDAEVQYLLGLCYLKKNEFVEAEKYFKHSLDINNTFKDSIVNVYNNLARNAIKIDEPERALKFYQAIARLVHEFKQASNLSLVGDINFEKKNYFAAISAYRQALEIDSTSKLARRVKHNLIKSLIGADSLHSALELATQEYEKLKTAANLLQLSEVKFALGKKYLATAQYDSAEIFFQSIVHNQEPKSLLDDAYFYLGEIYQTTERMEKAVSAYKKVLRLDPYQKGPFTRKAKERLKELKEKL